jgi:hypothetical protein
MSGSQYAFDPTSVYGAPLRVNFVPEVLTKAVDAGTDAVLVVVFAVVVVGVVVDLAGVVVGGAGVVVAVPGRH